jgi:hypothetical protein
MIRPIGILIIAALLLTGMSSGAESGGSSGYTVRQYALISFDAPVAADDAEEISGTADGGDASANETRPGGEMTAKKLFELRQAAQRDYLVLRNITGDDSLGFSPTKTQSVAIVCKQCIPQPSED